MSQHIRREREIAWSEDNALNKKKELSEPDNPFPTGDTPVQNRKIPIFYHKYSDISGNNKFDACRTSLLTYRITTRISQQPSIHGQPSSLRHRLQATSSSPGNFLTHICFIVRVPSALLWGKCAWYPCFWVTWTFGVID